MKQILLALSLLLVAGSSFGDEKLERRVREISDNLRCPTCQGLSVKDSEAGLSVVMKNKVREMLIEGKSEDQILQFFEERYGEWILRAPRKTGFNLILWVLPGLGILIAILWVGFSANKWRRPSSNAQGTSELSQEQKEEIDRDLNNLGEL